MASHPIPTSDNFQLPGYRLIDRLYSDAKTIVYRAQPTELDSTQAERTVIIKVLAAEYPTYQELLNFRHQYTILQGRGSATAKNLDLPGIVRTYSLEEYRRVMP
jgi:hypothetical protein